MHDVEEAPVRPLPRFKVLCRLDAYADYLAEVEAESPKEAAELAQDRHEDYIWENQQTAEFDARFYVTLDENEMEIESTHIGDF